MSSPTREVLHQALAQINALQAQAAAVQKAIEAALQAEITTTPLPYCHVGDADLWQAGALAREFGIEPHTLRRWARENEGLGQMIGGRWWIYRSRLIAYLGLGIR